MASFYYLSQSDRDLLDRLAVLFRGTVTPNRQYAEDDPVPKSQDIYIALVPEDGIPAATNNTGDGGPDLESGDKPGSLECDIYRVVNGELQFTGSKQIIYNINSADVNEGWIAVQRDKYGTWLADIGSSCKQNEIHHLHNINGNSGSFDWTILGSVITVDFDVTASELKTQLEGIVNIGTGNVDVTGGPFPYANFVIEYIGGLEGQSIAGGFINVQNLYQSDDETGTDRGNVIVIRFQQGVGV